MGAVAAPQRRVSLGEFPCSGRAVVAVAVAGVIPLAQRVMAGQAETAVDRYDQQPSQEVPEEPQVPLVLTQEMVRMAAMPAPTN